MAADQKANGCGIVLLGTAVALWLAISAWHFIDMNWQLLSCTLLVIIVAVVVAKLRPLPPSASHPEPIDKTNRVVVTVGIILCVLLFFANNVVGMLGGALVALVAVPARKIRKNLEAAIVLAVAISAIIGFRAATMPPPSVGYGDVLTVQNAKTFAEYNKGWDSDDPDNVAYVQKAIQHLHTRAYGRTFGSLMGWEKSYETGRQAQRHEAAAAAGTIDVGYHDVLTPQNEKTFAKRNTDWNDDDPNNVAYVQRAVSHLGARALGRTFGGLMNWEKAYEAKPKALAAARDWWHRTVISLATTRVYFEIAASSAATDPITASTALEKAHQFAERARNESTSVDIPDGWEDVAQSLWRAAGDYADAAKKLRTFLDNDAPSEASDAEQDAQDAHTMIVDAQDRAAIDYVNMGGASSDLLTVREAERDEKDIMALTSPH